MGTELSEQRLGDIGWLRVTGERKAAFRALGERMRQEIGVLLREMPGAVALRSRVARNPATAAHFRAVADASAAAHPAAYAELESMAAGAEADLADLLLLTLRGDLGADRGGGCSDIGVTNGSQVTWGHNEDGDPALDGRSLLLTVQVDDDPCVTCWWYPGFLPGNTFTVSECGLAWGIDGLFVAAPPQLPSRAFVARGAQSCRSLDEVATFLAASHSAGGFAYALCGLDPPRLAVIEAAAGKMAMTEADPAAGPLWHTNHFRDPAVGENPGGLSDSLERGDVLAAVARDDVDRDFLLGLLATNPRPHGVRQAGVAGVRTLSTLIIDQGHDIASVAAASGTLVTLPVRDLATGDASRAAVSRVPGR